MATYIVQTDFESYMGSAWTTTDPVELERIMEEAERDIDSLLTFTQGPRSLTTNLKLDPTQIINLYDLAALKRATCAQTEYRIIMGDKFFARPQYKATSAGGITTQGRLPWFGPKVRRELQETSFYQVSASSRTGMYTRGRRSVPPTINAGWPTPAFPWDV